MTEPTITYGHGKLYDFENGFLFKDSSTYTTSADGAAGKTTTVDASLTEANDYWNGCYIKYLSAVNADNVGETKEITDFDAASDTLTHDAFTAQTKDTDTFQLSCWKIVEDGQTLDTPTSTNGDYLTLTASATGGNAAGYLTNFANLSLSTAVHTKILWRYKTSSTSIKAKIVLEFSDATTQEVLADASSTTWATGSATITTAKTLDHIRLHADHATGTVYYDYILVCSGIFTFPNAESIDVIPSSDLVRTAYPARIGRAPQTMGADDTKVLIRCDLDVEYSITLGVTGCWKRSATQKETATADTLKGEIFLDINHNGSIDEPFQWLTTGHGHELKVRLETPQFLYSGDRHLLNLTFYEYRFSSADDENYEERYGL